MLCSVSYSHSAVIETAIKYVVAERPLGGLTYQDLFFREVRSMQHHINPLELTGNCMYHPV
jgi:hypothetical protein